MSWQHEVFSNELQHLVDEWLNEEKNGTMEETEDGFKTGCKVCGTLTGIHGFSFDRKNTAKDR